MGKPQYSTALCRELIQAAASAETAVDYRPSRYDAGDALEIDFWSVESEIPGHGSFRVEEFAGGGFAGQVYRCVLERTTSRVPGLPGIEVGRSYAVKILIPPTGFSRRFRDFLYWMGFQAHFGAQVNPNAARSGALWQKLVRAGAGALFGREDAVADIYALFYDSTLKAYGEIREWVEGRTWRLEADAELRRRRHWRNVPAEETGSPEYTAKRQFMAHFVRLLHEMGGAEFARQYEWWTMKSQPNVLKRHHAGDAPSAGLCAMDFRSGLVLLPFFPMSPADIPLILAGIRRGAPVQFDRYDFEKLRDFAARHEDKFKTLAPLIDAMEDCDRAYRRSQPDITRQGLLLLNQGALRRDVACGLIQGYRARDIIDEAFAARLRAGGWRFTAFYMLGLLPLLGGFCRRLWGNARYRRHVAGLLFDRDYFRRAMRAAVAIRVAEWHRRGRTGEARTRFLAAHPVVFWLQQCTLFLLPSKWHRVLAEPGYAAARIRETWTFFRRFYKDPAFRENWLKELVERGYQDGMLEKVEREEILARIGDPFIAKYLKCLAVHLATLPVTEIVLALIGCAVAVGTLLSESLSWRRSLVAFGLVVAAFPVSPGSLCRGVYVLYVMVRERNFKDYTIAAPVAFVKGLGYLSFPMQMVATYPALSRFMAGRWATNAARIAPVFGEKGALLEHLVFDLFFNAPRGIGRWARARPRLLLDSWLLMGMIILIVAFAAADVACSSALGINLTLGVTGLFVLPRILFRHRSKGIPKDV